MLSQQRPHLRIKTPHQGRKQANQAKKGAQQATKKCHQNPNLPPKEDLLPQTPQDQPRRRKQLFRSPLTLPQRGNQHPRHCQRRGNEGHQPKKEDHPEANMLKTLILNQILRVTNGSVGVVTQKQENSYPRMTMRAKSMRLPKVGSIARFVFKRQIYHQEVDIYGNLPTIKRLQMLRENSLDSYNSSIFKTSRRPLLKCLKNEKNRYQRKKLLQKTPI